jgi:NTE family protein
LKHWLVTAALVWAFGAEAQAPTAPPLAPEAPPALGLVLSGGGARGLAHIGVLKVLERERIPVVAVAGTSMGAIVGGLYATGMSPAELEKALLALDWAEVFARRVDRPHLPLRQKEEDYAFSGAVEMGVRDGELRAPQGTVSSRGLEVMLRRLTLPVRHIDQFAELPTPFRAVATDMENGEARVLTQGDLAQAMRASMSVPGLFAPIEWGERLLGDGGLVNNLPVDVARAMGAQRVIAVNVGTPLSPRKNLTSLIGVTTQMVNILTEQNVKRSLASLWDDDLLIAPQLDAFSSGDFDQAAAIVRAGELAAEAALPRLRALAVSPTAYAAWQGQRHNMNLPPPRLVSIRFEGSTLTRAERYQALLTSKVGDPFDSDNAVRDTRLLAASGDYARVDFRLEPSPVGDALVFELDDKPWGPNYLRIGLDLSTDVTGNSHFNLRVSHNRHWLNRLGGEWRNQLTLGRTPRLFSELYQPLAAQAGTPNDWFVSTWGEALSRQQSLFDANGTELAQLRRRSLTSGLDLGQPWGRHGELRLGLWQQTWRWHADLAPNNLNTAELGVTQRIGGLRGVAQIDVLDDANFPRRGWRARSAVFWGEQRSTDARVTRLELDTSQAKSWGPHTLNLQLRAAAARQGREFLGGTYTLGGFGQLSGLRNDQLSGNALLLGRASWYVSLTDAPVFTRGWFVGGSVEAGNTWPDARQLSVKGLRFAGSAFVGADTGLGPLYLAVGSAQRGGTALYVFIGRP